MQRRILMALSLCLLSANLCYAGDSWEKINEEDKIKVYKKDIKGSSYVAFKGEGIVKMPIRVVLGVIVDNKHRTEWVARLKKSTVLERISAFEFIVYQHFELPALMSDRDYVYRAKGWRNKQGQVIVDLSSCKHPKAPSTVGVRAELIKSRYVLTPVGKNEMETKVEVEIQTDPKGWIPAWLTNMIQKSWPLKTLRGIRKQVTKSYAKAYNLPPIKGAPMKIKKKVVKKVSRKTPRKSAGATVKKTSKKATPQTARKTAKTGKN